MADLMVYILALLGGAGILFAGVQWRSRGSRDFELWVLVGLVRFTQWHWQRAFAVSCAIDRFAQCMLSHRNLVHAPSETERYLGITPRNDTEADHVG